MIFGMIGPTFEYPKSRSKLGPFFGSSIPHNSCDELGKEAAAGSDRRRCVSGGRLADSLQVDEFPRHIEDFST